MIHGHYPATVNGKPVLLHYAYVAVGSVPEHEVLARWLAGIEWERRKGKV